MKLISRSEVLSRTSLSQATLWRMERAGEFPKAIRISANRVAYPEELVDEWIEEILSKGGLEQ